MNQPSENINETLSVGDTPEAQVVSVEGGATSESEQSDAERNAAIAETKAAAKAIIDSSNGAGFVLVVLQDDGTADTLLAGDYATVVHAVHSTVCALGKVVKHVQSAHDGNPEKHAAVEDFSAGASVLTIHHGMVSSMHADKLAEAAIEAAASTKQ